jgi:GNAT superfamily N-acetyltransferase
MTEAPDDTNASALPALVEATFSVDGTGRMIGDETVPVLYVLRSRDSVLCRFHSDLTEMQVRRLGEIANRERSKRPREWPMEYGEYINVLANSGLRVTAMRAGPLYAFPDTLAHRRACIPITEDNKDLLRGGLDEWIPAGATPQPFIAAVVDGRAVAICASVSRSSRAHAAGVETDPHFRGRGLAAAVVAAWAGAVRSQGAIPYYGTSFDNLASQAVARRLGLKVIASEFSISCAR